MKRTKQYPGGVKLTKRTARSLIEQITGVKKIEGGETAPGVYRYTAQAGSLEIRCENDWFNLLGRYVLHIVDGIGGNQITMYFHPDTLNRDFVMERAEKDGQRRESRAEWVRNVGVDMAHKLVDRYWGYWEGGA